MEQEKCINDKYMGWTKVTKAIIPPQQQQPPQQHQNCIHTTMVLPIQSSFHYTFNQNMMGLYNTLNFPMMFE